MHIDYTVNLLLAPSGVTVASLCLEQRCTVANLDSSLYWGRNKLCPTVTQDNMLYPEARHVEMNSVKPIPSIGTVIHDFEKNQKKTTYWIVAILAGFYCS